VENFLNSQTDGEDIEQRLTERLLIAGGLETPVFSTESQEMSMNC